MFFSYGTGRKKERIKKVRDPHSFCSQKFFENILKEYKSYKKRIEKEA